MNAGEIVISEGGWNIHGGSPCLHGEIPAIWPAWNVQYEGNLVVQFSEDTTVTCRICEAIKDQIRQGIYEPGASLPSTWALAAEWDVSRDRHRRLRATTGRYIIRVSTLLGLKNTVEPSTIPSFYTTAKASLNTRDCCSSSVPE